MSSVTVTLTLAGYTLVFSFTLFRYNNNNLNNRWARAAAVDVIFLLPVVDGAIAAAAVAVVEQGLRCLVGKSPRDESQKLLMLTTE
ncbi:hypothetical protein FSARC_2938 [Fusarium sarcochroum]|uniref:Uncharacterized protein n=1 Tax=Fusarium sarcochroum TaxID=1208366 RepID=A0A8H4U562_9HYPO|nr:hypothetical protein FSARC_2938 [Fusarium sarcochroum]